MRRIPKFSVALALMSFLTSISALAQTEAAAISGRVADSQGLAIAGAKVSATNVGTNVTSSTQTNSSGFYNLPSLIPGTYRMTVEKEGFVEIVKPDVQLHVQDNAGINFSLEVGSVTQSVTVEGGAPLVNMRDATVSTVVNRKYVENMPLNGRSFQDLILLTPGVVTNSPQTTALTDASGQFSVNGQRTQSNYFLVDGVSGNFGGTIGQVGVTANTGSIPASTPLGTTQGLVSIDALEEFRVQSSSYSAEYGRNPGGQFSFVTRSGTNQLHGSAFDYVRNDAFDATDWFDGFLHQPKPPLRQNDFGVTLGGPVVIPHVYNGKDATFFFFSYEGLRLVLPQGASISFVPTVALRQSAPAAIKPVVNAFPLPNCPASATNCQNDLGDGLGQFIGSWSNPSSLDSYSVRLDHSVGQKLALFFRLSNTPSSQTQQLGGLGSDPAVVFSTRTTLRTDTLGATSVFSTNVSNEFRVNRSIFNGDVSSRITSFGGASPVDLAQVHGLNNSLPDIAAFMFFSGFTHITRVNQLHRQGLQRQWNVTDAMTVAARAHQIKLGVDYRTLAPVQKLSTPLISYSYFNQGSVLANSADSASVQSTSAAFPHFTNFSAFVQDAWRVTDRWNLSLGLRWEVNPAPSAPKGNLPYTIQGDVASPSTVNLAPQGTPLWHTTWHNLAPRIGTVYVLRDSPGSETVIRAGGGVFFDTGQQLGDRGYMGSGFSGQASYCPAGCTGPSTFPLVGTQLFPAIVNPPTGPGLLVFGFDPHLQLPFTWQWNAAIEQAIGKSQALTLSYVGANGRRLLQQTQFNLGTVNPNIGTLVFARNGLTSTYNAVQVQLQRRFSHGFQALASYTWSHSIDFGSRDISLPSLRGDSDFDVRHNLSGALSYDLPEAFHGLTRAILSHWGFDTRISARSAYPVILNGPARVNPATLQIFFAGLDVVPNQPLYLYGPQYPGGRRINPAAFSVPPAGQIGNAPRNFARGFGAWQTDFAVRREFPIHQDLKLQFRAEAFNIFNHTNYGVVNSSFCNAGPSCTFGEATATLARSLGGLSSIYQMGGARSMQFALRLTF